LCLRLYRPALLSSTALSSYLFTSPLLSSGLLYNFFLSPLLSLHLLSIDANQRRVGGLQSGKHGHVCVHQGAAVGHGAQVVRSGAVQYSNKFVLLNEINDTETGRKMCRHKFHPLASLSPTLTSLHLPSPPLLRCPLSRVTPSFPTSSPTSALCSLRARPRTLLRL
jgi:hypothetical protein